MTPNSPNGSFLRPARHSRSPSSASFWGNLARYALALFCVACGAAAFAVVFRHTVGWVFTHGYGRADVLSAFRSLPWYARVLIPAVGGGLAGSMSLLATKLKGGQGVGDVMEAVAVGKGHISLVSTVVKASASWLAIVSGGSVGREGPLIQFGGGLGGELGRRFGLRERQVRGLIAAGAAAGFAAAYNTPIAAVLFVVEVVTGVIALDIVLPAIIAVPIATAVTRLAIGGGPIYGQRSFSMSSNVELAAYAVLGLLSGLAGPLFMSLLSYGERTFAKVPGNRATRAALGGALVGVMAIVRPEVTGNGYEAINLLLNERLAIGLVVVLLFAKALATTASVSSGSPGGVFTPSLFLGAALGGTVGHMVLRLGQHTASGAVEAYALVGMAAMIAATVHAPIMASVLVFELSGDYAIALPLLTATAIATLVSIRVHPESVYTEELRRRGRKWQIKIVSDDDSDAGKA